MSGAFSVRKIQPKKCALMPSLLIHHFHCGGIRLRNWLKIFALQIIATKIHTGIPVEKNSLAGKPITVSICPSLSNFVRIIASAPPRNKTPCAQEKNITTYNLARMNMLLRGVKDNEFNISHGDSLTNEWGIVSICPSLSNFVRILASAPPRNKTPCGRMIAIVPSSKTNGKIVWTTDILIKLWILINTG
jgi:hypothetical protein